VNSTGVRDVTIESSVKIGRENFSSLNHRQHRSLKMAWFYGPLDGIALATQTPDGDAATDVNDRKKCSCECFGARQNA